MPLSSLIRLLYLTPLKLPFMKKILTISAMLLIIAALFFSFNIKKPKTKHHVPATVCNCQPVTNVNITKYTQTVHVNWTPPSGGDHVVSYNYAGYLSCAGSFSGTVTSNGVDIPNPLQCPNGTVTIKTNCVDANGNTCQSSTVQQSW